MKGWNWIDQSVNQDTVNLVTNSILADPKLAKLVNKEHWEDLMREIANASNKDSRFNYSVNFFYHYFEELGKIVGADLNYLTEIKALHADSFESDTFIDYISIPKNITFIFNHTFREAVNLKQISIEEGSELRGLGQGAFVECRKLSKIELPEGMRTVGAVCFKDCEDLSEVILPSSITLLGSAIFENCCKLYRIKYQGTIQNWRDKFDKNHAWYHSCEVSEIECLNGVYSNFR